METSTQDRSLSKQPLDGVRIIIPMLNAGRHLDYLLPALSKQVGLIPAQVMVIDSTSDDDTAARCASWGAEVLTIKRAEFNHGGTRRMASLCNPNARVLLFMTQDAIPAGPHAIERLAAAFDNPAISVAYGRQLPRIEAKEIERHARLYNYPAEAETRTLSDAQRLGIKACFCSNSFAAYRQTALQAVGGFPEEAYFAEDQIVAARMLLAGYTLAYIVAAGVIHSHGYKMHHELARYFDVGVFHSRNTWLLEAFGTAEKAGVGFVYSEVRHLLRSAPLRIPEAILRTVFRYAGYQLGRSEKKLSNSVKARFSMQPQYWQRQSSIHELDSCVR